jgi:hypothetical protein
MAGPLAKTVALRLLQHLLEGHLDGDTLASLSAGSAPVEDDTPF